MAQHQIQKVNWWHERLADWMLANPEKSIKDAALTFNCHMQTLYYIKNSDAFRVYWATRSGDFSNALKEQTLESQGALLQKTAAVTEAALDALGERLETIGSVMPVDKLVDISQMGLKALGYTASKASGTTVNVNFGAVDPKALERAREKIKAQYGRDVEKPREIEAVAVPVE